MGPAGIDNGPGRPGGRGIDGFEPPTVKETGIEAAVLGKVGIVSSSLMLALLQMQQVEDRLNSLRKQTEDLSAQRDAIDTEVHRFNNALAQLGTDSSGEVAFDPVIRKALPGGAIGEEQPLPGTSPRGFAYAHADVNKQGFQEPYLDDNGKPMKATGPAWTDVQILSREQVRQQLDEQGYQNVDLVPLVNVEGEHLKNAVGELNNDLDEVNEATDLLRTEMEKLIRSEQFYTDLAGKTTDRNAKTAKLLNERNG